MAFRFVVRLRRHSVVKVVENLLGSTMDRGTS